MTARLATLGFIAFTVSAQTPSVCLQHKRYGRLKEAQACFQRLSGSSDPYLRAEGFWGLGLYDDANAGFRIAVKQQPKNADYRVRWGRLFFERWRTDEAAKLFGEALEISPKHPGAMLGLAYIAKESYDKKAVELAEDAIKADPKLLEARELLAQLALEDGDREKAAAEADKALAMDPDALDAMAVHATLDLLVDKPTTWFDRIAKVNPNYGEAHAKAAHLFVLNRRYEEAIQLYRKALELNPQLWAARSQMGLTLMRLGEDDEARKNLEACYEAHFRDSATVNTLTLLDSYKKFVTIRSGNAILRLDKKEADLLSIYFLPELQRAIATYEQKYKFKLTKPVRLEVYPDHEDFAVRTMGMPGLGALGVTFGYVVAMDSPSGRKPGTFHWASTLWHELSHVFVLTATNHRTPRWFTEGLAVHEETAASPDWGDRLDPMVIRAYKDKKFLPVAQLDRGFIRPTYPTQVPVSYFQAGRICDYIKEKWGYDKLLAMMHDFAKVTTTSEVIEKELGMKPEEFDKQFMAWLDVQLKPTVDHFDEWSKGLRAVAAAAKNKDYGEVIKQGTAIRDLYPEYVEAGSAYEFLAEAYTEKGDKKAAAAELERYARIGGRHPTTLKKLADLQIEMGQKKEAVATLEKINFIYASPDEEMHKKLAELYLDLKNSAGAIREGRAAVASKPADPAAAHFWLAQAYRAASKLDDAREQVLLSLEAAPGFKPAQRLLLELSATSKKEN